MSELHQVPHKLASGCSHSITSSLHLPMRKLIRQKVKQGNKDRPILCSTKKKKIKKESQDLHTSKTSILFLFDSSASMSNLP